MKGVYHCGIGNTAMVNSPMVKAPVRFGNSPKVPQLERIIGGGLRSPSASVLLTLRAKLSGAVYCYQSCLWACLKRAGEGAGGV